jgi:hypothetical protein
MSNSSGMILIRKNWGTERKTCLIAMLYITNPAQTGLGLKLDSHGDRLGTNSLSHGIAVGIHEKMCQFWLKFEPGTLWRLCNDADHCNATFSQGQISMDEGAKNLTHFNTLRTGHLNCFKRTLPGFNQCKSTFILVSWRIYKKFANCFCELKFSGNTHHRP